MALHEHITINGDEQFWSEYVEIVNAEHKQNREEMMDQIIFYGLQGQYEHCGVRIHSEGTKDGKQYNFTFSIHREDNQFYLTYVGREEE